MQKAYIYRRRCTFAAGLLYFVANSFGLHSCISMKDDGIQKLYYSIGEVSDLTELEQHVLRYWESEFEQLKPRKNRAGRRVYTEEDIEMVRRIHQLLKEDKYTIEGAKQVLDSGQFVQSEERRGQLRELRGFLTTLLDRLEEE